MKRRCCTLLQPLLEGKSKGKSAEELCMGTAGDVACTFNASEEQTSGQYQGIAFYIGHACDRIAARAAPARRTRSTRRAPAARRARSAKSSAYLPPSSHLPATFLH